MFKNTEQGEKQSNAVACNQSPVTCSEQSDKPLRSSSLQGLPCKAIKEVWSKLALL